MRIACRMCGGTGTTIAESAELERLCPYCHGSGNASETSQTTNTLALIPAKRHSSGVPNKNWMSIHPDGRSCTQLAIDVGRETCRTVVVSTTQDGPSLAGAHVIRRPLGTPDAMLDVVKHALSVVPGPDDEIIVLLQPTSPLRSVETVKRAIEMLEGDPDASSVVSVSESYPLAWTLIEAGGYLGHPFLNDLGMMKARRQDCAPTYKRDGVVYAFRRKHLASYGNIYGIFPRALHTPPAESLSIDTQEDWDEAVRRLSAKAWSLLHGS